MSRILVVDDEPEIRRTLGINLRVRGYDVDLAPDGEQALVKSRVVRYDVLVLDRDLPGVHGDDVCKTVRDERPDTGIHALARRTSPSRPPVLRHGDLELDPARRRLTRSGHELELARKEFAVLEALMAADGATVSAEQLLERVWDEHTDPFTNVVRMTIMTLRRKLGEPAVVQTVGYRMA